jgi:hypothetical protein
MIALPQEWKSPDRQECASIPRSAGYEATELRKAAPFTKLLEVEQKAIIKLVEQEYLTYLFLNNSSQRYIPN